MLGESASTVADDVLSTCGVIEYPVHIPAAVHPVGPVGAGGGATCRRDLTECAPAVIPAKYQGFSNEITPADLPEAIRKEVNRLTLIAYKRLNCRGVVRIDFIVKGETPYMIEINTIPGMSSHSIIPQQAATMGMSLTELFNLIIDETSNK